MLPCLCLGTYQSTLNLALISPTQSNILVGLVTEIMCLLGGMICKSQSTPHTRLLGIILFCSQAKMQPFFIDCNCWPCRMLLQIHGMQQDIVVLSFPAFPIVCFTLSSAVFCSSVVFTCGLARIVFPEINLSSSPEPLAAHPK